MINVLHKPGRLKKKTTGFHMNIACLMEKYVSPMKTEGKELGLLVLHVVFHARLIVKI